MHESIELWRSIYCWPGYEISNLGRIKSLERESTYSRGGRDVKRLVSERILKPYRMKYRGTNKTKATKVSVWLDKRKAERCVHHLVLEAFVGHRPDGQEACHGDGNAENNRLRNLRWDTRLANARDAVKHGTIGKRRSQIQVNI